MFRLNSLGDAGGVVVGRLEHLDVLDQVDAQQQAVVGPVEQPRARRRAALPRHRVEVAEGAAEEQDEAPARRRRHVLEVSLEVADHAVHAEARIVPHQPAAVASRVTRSTSNGT